MKRILAVCLLLCMILSLAACQNGTEKTTGSTAVTPGPEVLHTVTISSNAGTVPGGIKYYVYKGLDKADGIASYGALNTDGIISYVAPDNSQYMLVLEDVPEGYDAMSSYTISQVQTDIVLTASLVMDQSAAEKEYYNGDVMRDFTITDVDGNVHTISELLKTKKAVVLNFWNIDCSPCKAEFPHLLKAYEEFKDDIALIAMNPVKSDSEAEIRKFRDQFGLTFPVASCDPAWIQAMAQRGNPTTVIIDRYGVICVKETGGIDEGVFETVFAHFVAEDYQQILIRSMTEFAENSKNP